MTEQERNRFLTETRVAVMSVAAADGRPPISVPVWYGYEPGGNFTYFTGYETKKSRKIRQIEQTGRLTFCVQQEALPYKYVTVEGTVVQTEESPPVERILPIVQRYLPGDAAQAFVDTEINRPNTTPVLYTIRPDRWSSLDFSEDMQER
jgi:nitroimidazol reductase NimA-like FMN-containing flavoprotein (pyridoxamine 5'-phosphate oxidase superfamily)